MVSYLKRIVIIFLVFLSTNGIFAQVASQSINIHFLKKKVVIKENSTFFNILIIENTSGQDTKINLKINVPRDWKLVGNSIEEVFLPANRPTHIPIRVAVSKTSLGGVGYSISANILNSEGDVLKTESNFIRFPIKKDLIIKTEKKTSYFDNKTLESKFILNINNQGNINELLDIKIIPDQNLLLNENLNNEAVYTSLNLASKKDTNFQFLAKINPITDYKRESFFKVNIEIKSKASDSIIKKTVWFNYLDWEYYNEINETNHPLIVNLTAQNLFNDSDVKYRTHIYGRTLLKNKKSVFYSFENRNRTNTETNLWINSQWKIGAEVKNTTLILGDYSGNFEENMYGRGIYISQKMNRNLLQATVTERLISDRVNYGISYKHNFRNNLSLESGFAFSDDKSNFSTNKVAFIKPSFSIKKNNQFFLSFGVNEFTNKRFEDKTTNGFAYNIGYSTKFNQFKINLKNEYGSPNYVGYTKGRFYLRSLMSYQFKNTKDKLNFSFSDYRIRPSYLLDNTYVNNKFTYNEQANLFFTHSLKNNLYLKLGALYIQEETNNITGLDVNSSFASQSLKAEIGFQISSPVTRNSFNLSGKFGMTNINKYSDYLSEIFYQNLDQKKPYSVAELRLNIRRKNYGVFLVYFNGPYSIAQQFTYFYGNSFSKSFSIMPYYEDYLYKKNLKISLRSSYVKDLVLNSTKYNLNTRLVWLSKKDWSFEFLSTVSMQQRIQISTKSNFFYTSTYFEFGIKKIFGLQQPRVKYRNFNAMFYKDYNGDGHKDPNEAGINNILVNLRRQNPEDDLINPNYNGEFMSNELLSNYEGEIYYENMPEGDYFINYEMTNKSLSEFYNPDPKLAFSIKKNDTTIFIPFAEKNKIFGRVILHKAKYSNEKYSIANIRISVEGNDQIYTTLTDEMGYFEITIPVTEVYKVSVNNIFKENFNLRQKSYNVRFNGYKKFEVTFDFDEKKREILFRDDEIYETEDSQFQLDSSIIMQQTTLRGEIKSNKFSNPLFANVAVHNMKTNELITEVVASINTGKYSTTFYTGEDYSLTVSFSGYWTRYEELHISQITTFDYITRNIRLQKIEMGDVIRTSNLLFPSLKSKLSEAAKVELDNIAIKLKRNLDINFDIIGYTDNDESLRIDAERLSANRAIAVMNYLIDKGISSRRMKPLGYGDRNPEVPNNSAQARKKNRRVVIKINDFNPEIKAH